MNRKPNSRLRFHWTPRLSIVSCQLSIILFLTLSGCASFGERHLKIRRDFERGQLEEARNEIDARLKKNRRGESDVLKLNQALIELCSGRPKESEKILREVRDNFERYEQKNIAEGTASYLLDDNVISYAGEDYERVLIRVFLALSNLMYDGTDASAYALQIGQKQNEIIARGQMKDPKSDDKKINVKESYRQIAIGEYIIGAMREETQLNYDDARRSYEAVCAWEPNFTQGHRDLERAKHGIHSAKGNGVVYVFGLVGPGPYKLQENSEVSQASLFIASIILSMIGKHSVTPGIAPVMIPVVVRPRETVPSLLVTVNGRRAGQTETITDIGRMAEEQFDAVRPQIVAKAIIRRAVKKGILYGAKEFMDVNPWIGLAMDLGGIIWEATETADTRCWNLLPAEIQVARIELPAGEHNLILQPASRVYSLSSFGYISTPDSVPTGTAASRTIRVYEGRNTYVLANFPNNQLVGEIVVSNE